MEKVRGKGLRFFLSFGEVMIFGFFKEEMGRVAVFG